jgi:hypothetical protein
MIVSHSSDEVYDWDEQLKRLPDSIEEMDVVSAYPESITRTNVAEWQLDKDGLAIKGCAIIGPEGARYGLIIARRSDDGDFTDPRNLTRDQIQAIHDFTGFMLEDSEG